MEILGSLIQPQNVLGTYYVQLLALSALTEMR